MYSLQRPCFLLRFPTRVGWRFACMVQYAQANTAEERRQLMHPHAALIEEFYQAFARRDAEGMIACYHPNVTFSDPVFQQLQSDEASAMWRMLTKSSADLDLTYRAVTADDAQGQADWTAIYTFSQTGRKVRNEIHAAFQFQDGKIITHQDTFDLWRWAGMALGPQGRLLGWTPLMQRAIRQRARSRLEAFMRQQATAAQA